jgi:NAD+ kinase
MCKTENDLQKVVITTHPQFSEAINEADDVAEFLLKHGLKVDIKNLEGDSLLKSVRAREFDLLITLGGDGTMLRAGHLCAPYDIPILGINHGRFGFLIEVAKDCWRESLTGLFSGGFWFERRMMLRADHWRQETHKDGWDLINEAFIGRGNEVRPVHLITSLDGRFLTTYVADGLIISTPTGSTAYALAAGGPILPPELRNILVLPVAPHLTVDRAIVLSEGSSISVIVSTVHSAVMSGDGHPPVVLQDGDRIEVRASDHSVRFLRFQDPGYFYRQLTSYMDHNPSIGEK